MAKKSFDISSTLSKNKAPQLAEKIPLKKNIKDTEEVREKVERLHETNEVKSQSSPKILAQPVKKEATKDAKTAKLVRLTIDTPEGMHKKLKIRSIEKGISMRDYILQLLEKELSR